MFESRILLFSLIFSEEAYRLVLTWVVNMLTQLINRSSILIKNIIIIFFFTYLLFNRPVTDAVVQFVSAGVRDDSETFPIVIESLVDQFDMILEQIGPPVLLLLKLLMEKSDKSLLKV